MALNRVYGLSGSGIDVDSMVQKLMTAKRIPYDKMYQDKTRAEWKKTEYNNIYKDLAAYRNEVFDFKLKSNLGQKSTSVTNTGTTSNTTTVLTATAGSDAANVTHNIDVKQLAQSSNMTSTGAIGLAADKDQKLSTILGNITGDLTLTIADGTMSKDKDGNIIKDASGNPVPNVKTITYTKEELLTGKKNDKGEVIVGPKTINDLVSDLNKSGLQVQAQYDEKLDRLFLYNNESGKDSQLTLGTKDADGNTSAMGVKLLEGLKLAEAGVGTASTTDQVQEKDANGNLVFESDGTTPKMKDKFIRGKDSLVIIDGLEISDKSNSFTVAGVNYNLQNTGTVKVSITSDLTGQVDAVKKFVDSYNTMLEKLIGKRDEVYYKDYPPLTDEQKKAMSEDQIKQWETKSKSGMLRNDSNIKSLISKMRNSVVDGVTGIGGEYTSAANIGIGTKGYEEGGKLYLDEAKLRKALEADPNVLTKIFGTEGTNAETSMDDGIAVRLYDNLTATNNAIYRVAGTSSSTGDTSSVLGKQISNYTDKMKAFSKKLTTWENMYYKKFNAMEQALSQLNSQMSFLTASASSGQ